MQDGNEYYIEHYGVKGMKWGVRKDKPKKKRNVKSEDHETMMSYRRRNVQSLSNNELRKMNERMNLLSNYSKLTNPKDKKSALKKITAGLLGAAATYGTLYNFVKSPAGKSIIEPAKQKIVDALSIDFSDMKL